MFLFVIFIQICISKRGCEKIKTCENTISIVNWDVGLSFFTFEGKFCGCTIWRGESIPVEKVHICEGGNVYTFIWGDDSIPNVKYKKWVKYNNLFGLILTKMFLSSMTF